MILTNCAACAAPLAHDAPRCVRCHTRYCNKTCQHDHAHSLYADEGVTLDNLREAVSTLEDTERTARRVLGGVHPVTVEIEGNLRASRAVLRARETPSSR